MGFNGTGMFIQSGGTNSTIGSLNLGANTGSNGTYDLSGTGSLFVNSPGGEAIGVSGGTGTFNQSGGTNTVEGGNGLYLGANTTSSNGTYTLSGTASLSVTNGNEWVGFNGTGMFIQSGGTNKVTGALALAANSGSTGAVTLSGGSTTVSGSAYVGGAPGGAGGSGTLTVSGTGQLSVAGTLTVYDTGRLNINGGTTTVGGLSIAIGGIVNVNGVLFIDYGSGSDPIASIEQWIKNGYFGLSGPQIISSSIATDDALSGLSYGIGYADSADPGNPAGLPTDTIEIGYTLLGDANLDGTVNAEDFTLFSEHLGQSGMMWDNGDFNYDGTVNAEDFTLFSANLGQSATLAAGALEAANGISLVNVPEPVSEGMMMAAGLGILLRRRRRAT